MTLEEWKALCEGRLIAVLYSDETEPANRHRVGICTNVEWCCRNRDVRVDYTRADGTHARDTIYVSNTSDGEHVIVWGHNA